MTQFLRDQASDSEEVVTPLMLDGTYLSRKSDTVAAGEPAGVILECISNPITAGIFLFSFLLSARCLMLRILSYLLHLSQILSFDPSVRPLLLFHSLFIPATVLNV